MSWLLWLLCLVPPVLLVAWGVDLTENSPFVLVDVGALGVIAFAVQWVKRLPPTACTAQRILPSVAVSLLAGGIAFGVAWWDPQVGWAMGSAWGAAVLAGLIASRAQDVGGWLGAGALAVSAVASSLSLGLREGVFEAPFMTTVVATSMGVGLYARSERRLAESQRRAAVIQERQAMAAELHDIIAHEVTGIVVLAQALGPRAAQAGIGAEVGSIEKAGVRTLHEIRTLVAGSTGSVDAATSATAATSGASGTPGASRTPRPPRPHGAQEAQGSTAATRSPESVGSPAAHATGPRVEEIRGLVEAFAATTPAQVSASLPTAAEWAALEPAVALAAHRIVAEALTNTRRHAASAAHVEVAVARGPRELVFCIRDDGAGGGIGAGSGVGLAGIRDRAAGVGGHAEAGPGDVGWVVRASLPCGPDDAAAPGRPTERAPGRRRHRSTTDASQDGAGT